MSRSWLRLLWWERSRLGGVLAQLCGHGRAEGLAQVPLELLALLPVVEVGRAAPHDQAIGAALGNPADRRLQHVLREAGQKTVVKQCSTRCGLPLLES